MSHSGMTLVQSLQMAKNYAEASGVVVVGGKPIKQSNLCPEIVLSRNGDHNHEKQTAVVLKNRCVRGNTEAITIQRFEL